MRILIVYPGNIFSTFDVAAGYDAALRGLGHEVKDFSFYKALQFFKEAMDVRKANNPDDDAPDDAYVALASEQIAVTIADFKPDVALVASGLAFGIRGYQMLYALGVPVVILLTESPYLDEYQARMAVVTSAVGLLTNDAMSVEPLTEAAGVPVAYVPHSYDPARHHKMDADDDKRADIFFHGTLWPERAEMFAGLQGLPYNTHISGIQPGTIGKTTLDQVIPNSHMAEWYNGAEIALNHNRTCKGIDGAVTHIEAGDAWSLGPRAFEIAACGAFQLCDNTRQELAEIFGDSVATYANQEGLRARADYFMQHPAERRDMAMESMRRVADCTFSARAEQIVVPFLQEAI